MFDIGAAELLVIVIVAVIVIGPKDLPLAMRTAGRWIGKMRKLSSHFRSGIDAMVREAELEDMEKKWKEQNARIMREHPQGGPKEMEPTGAYPPPAATPAPASAESAKPVEPVEPAPAPAPASAPDPTTDSTAKPGNQA
ncbi:Sec-independent protein translocase protein TatB [Aurantiacibacter flavus]|uniref:Sec-independent protein translocase protein TatB n=1 Tax=Aurantiacibacter flavus TaxID=3145232 RepID=A0ABV0CXG8_9SPHN